MLPGVVGDSALADHDSFSVGERGEQADLARCGVDLLPGAFQGTGVPVGPREVWRNDQMRGLVVGIAVGVVFGLMTGFTGGLAGGLTVGLGCGLVISRNWSTILAWLQLQLSRQVPAIRLMSFLEDARGRDILRTVGAVYQFRHAKLQDQLAN